MSDIVLREYPLTNGRTLQVGIRWTSHWTFYYYSIYDANAQFIKSVSTVDFRKQKITEEGVEDVF